MKDVYLLGATSHIAKALIYQNFLCQAWNLSLFARSPDKVREFLKSIGYVTGVEVHAIGSFPEVESGAYAVINCAGFGTPQKMKVAGADLFFVTESVDNQILAYLEKNLETKYIHFSSGAVYGTAMDCPISVDYVPTISLSPLDTPDFYRITKIYQEAKHRAMSQYAIVDVRLFSFFSRFIDLSGGYLMTDIVRALETGEPLVTGSGEIHRDYISPADLFSFLDRIIQGDFINGAFDTFSLAPISKTALLESLKQEFGLKVRVENGGMSVASPTGTKPYYYSEDRTATTAFGYQPTQTSWEGIRHELTSMGFPRTQTE